jgi:ABC-type transport system involved in multi-copper enzyme maturation permease subunit
MLPLLRSELFRLTHRMMTRVMLLAMVVLVVGTYVLLWATSGSLSEADLVSQKDDLRLANAPEYGMAIAYQVGFLLSIVLAGSSIATEYGWGTIRTLLSRTESRSAFLVAKLLAILVFIACSALVGAASVLAGSAIVAAAGDLNTHLDGGFASRALLSCGRVFVVLIPYASLSFLVALWSRTTAAGIVVVVVAFYAEVLLTPLFEAGGAVSWFPEDGLIFRNIRAILETNSLTPDPSFPSAWSGLAVLAVYSAVFLSAAVWRFNSRDVTLS